MKTHLIFKRQETIDGVVKVVTKIIPVEVPYINSGEGWILSGHADVVDVVTDNSPVEIPAQVATSSSEVSKQSEEPLKFESDVKGTAKLVRSKGVIKIVARRGKSTYNQTTPNSVCINDFTKNEFFKNCREIHANTGCFEFTMKDGRPYDYWNDIIDKEYQRQKTNYCKKEVKNYGI